MKYFYTDPFAAAWMAKHFGMRFQASILSTDTGETYIDNVTEDMLYSIINCQKSVRSYIHEDSMYILQPLQGDAIIGDYSGFEQIRFWDVADERKTFGRIIERNGLAFMWPKSKG